MRKIGFAAERLTRSLRSTFERFNEIVRTTQKLQPGRCGVCGAEGISFMCQKCGKAFCPTHAYSTFGLCPDCATPSLAL